MSGSDRNPEIGTAWSAFGRDVIEDLKSTGSDFWDELREDQIPIVERTTNRAADLVAELIAAPHAERLRIENNLRFLWATLQLESAVTTYRAEREIKEAIGRVIRRATALALSFVPGG